MISTPLPYYSSLFENISIFNSILIMLSNNSFINEYFSQEKDKDKVKHLISECNKHNKFCLSSILYYFYNYLWNTNNKSLISIIDLKQKYKVFFDCYSITNCHNSNPELYCYNKDNVKGILSFIYFKINNELSAERLETNINTYIYQGIDLFSSFLFEFNKNNKSKISDNFMGFYEIQTFCAYCKSRNERFPFSINNNTINYRYINFSYITFYLEEIINYYYPKKDLDDIQYINLYNCFQYQFQTKFNKYPSNCKFCFSYSYICEYKYIYCLPKILTLILNSNNNSYIILQDEINLNQYTKNKFGYGIYYIVSILCQFIYNNKFICYCINPNNGRWYSYEDGKINEVEKMDINAKPLLIIYQEKGTIRFNYKYLLRDDLNKVLLDIKFMNGEIASLQLFFNRNTLIKDIIEQIKFYSNLHEENLQMMLNGDSALEDQMLSCYLQNNKNKESVLINVY